MREKRWMILIASFFCWVMVAARNDAVFGQTEAVPASVKPSELEFSVSEVDRSPSESSIRLLWGLGTAIKGLEGGSFVLLKSSHGEFLGWMDSAGKIQSALLVGSVKRDNFGGAMLERVDLEGAVLYQPKGEMLNRVPGMIETTSLDFEKGSGFSKGTYASFACRLCNPYSIKLLQMFGVACKGSRSPARMRVDQAHSWDVVIGADGKIAQIVGYSWDLKLPQKAKK